MTLIVFELGLGWKKPHRPTLLRKTCIFIIDLIYIYICDDTQKMDKVAHFTNLFFYTMMEK